jgi:hypothetical protein
MRQIYIYKNARKEKPTHPDYSIIIKQDGEIVEEAGGYIATDRETGEKRHDKNGNTFISGKLQKPRNK